MAVISVIVPVYNVEPYLRRCVDSILAQALTDIEIILVDDGSPDGCPAICDEYACKDSRVKVIHKENGGLSSARNAGLDRATGEYIGFVDSDDYISPEMYESLLHSLIKEHADIAICGFQKVNDSGMAIGPKNVYNYMTLTGIQALEKLYTNDYIYFTISCNKLFKSSLFSSYRYPVGKIYEDGYAAFRYYFACKTIICTPGCHYFYLARSNSITTSKITVRNFDGLDAEVDSIDFLVEKGLNDLVAKALPKYVSGIIYVLQHLDLKQKDIRLKLHASKPNFNRLFPRIMKNTFLSKKEKVLISIFRISPRLCQWVIKVKKL